MSNDRDAFDEKMPENAKTVRLPCNHGENTPEDISFQESAIITAESNDQCTPTVTIYAREDNRIHLNGANIKALEDMQCCGLNTDETAHGNVVPRNTIVYVRNLESSRTTVTNRGTSDEVFSKRGDSGSIICLIESTHTDIRHKALSMLFAGDLKIEGDESLKCLSFKLNVGFQMLKQIHNLDF
jgi:hypothetical protein